ncbi:MAG: lipoprotein-releasing ABC transporter permease subunit, partial [Alphaproteobacteria bacterium]
ELLTRVLGLNGQLGVYPAWGDTLADYETKRAAVAEINGVAAVFPVVDGQVMANTDGGSAGVMVRGMAAADFRSRPILMNNYRGVDLADFEDNTVIVGYRLASKLAVRAGDVITLVSPKGNITAFGTIPKMKAYRVAGTFNSGMFEYDDNFIFMPLAEAQKFFMMKQGVSHLEVFTDKTADVGQVLEAAFDAAGEGAQVYDWRYTNQAFFNAIEVERNVMFLILTLIIVVAAFNMISGLIMLVRDKGRDIAILRTMGMTRGGIQRVFLTAGLIIGVTGTMAGVILGLLFSYNIDTIKGWLESLSGKELFSAEIYFLSHLPAKVDLTEVVIVAIMSLTLSLLATFYPSWKAGRTDPVEALRYE